MDQNTVSQRCFFGISPESGKSVVSIPSSSRICIIVHQEETRTHNFTIRSDTGSKDFVPIPKCSQGAVI